MSSRQLRVGIIGGGVAGLLSIKYCLAEGMQPVCFEQHDKMGGTWYYTEEPRPNQTASTHKNMTTNDNKDRMAFGDFPVPDHYPTFWNVEQYYEYLTSYAEHFDLLRHIRFNQTVTKVKPTEDYATTGRWQVFTRSSDSDGEEEHVFDAICLCSGAFSKGFIPDLPGLSDFKGTVMHSTDYRRPEVFDGQIVLVVGSRFSATEQACDITRNAKQVYISVGRGMHVAPRIFAGHSLTDFLQRRQLVAGGQESIGFGLTGIAAMNLNHAQFGIPYSGNPMLDGNITFTDEFVPCLHTGRIIVVPRVASFTHDSVVYADGSRQEIDAVVFGTGYETHYEYVECPDIQGTNPANYNLYKYVFPLSCKHPTLAVMSCGNGVFGVYAYHTEQAARWVARVFTGKCQLPPQTQMEKYVKEQHTFFQERCRGRFMRSEVLVGEELAAEIDVQPHLHRLIFRDPLLAYKVHFGPPIAAHYHLVGPGALDCAWTYSHQFYDRLFPNDVGDKKRKLTWFTAFVGGCLLLTAFRGRITSSSWFLWLAQVHSSMMKHVPR